MKKLTTLMIAALALAASGHAVLAQSAGNRLNTVVERGKLLCSGHNGSFLGFAEVDDKGAWKGLDIDLCRALAAALFGTSEGHLDIVPISWAQRWPSLQSGDIDVIIKVSGWTFSRDTELNLAYSMPYFVGAFQAMVKADLGATALADLDGGTVCVAAGTSTERAAATYLQVKGINAELLSFENGDEVRNAYYEDRCDAYVEWAPSLAAARLDAPDGADAHVILPDVIDLEVEGIIVPEGDSKWLDVQNWMLSSLWFAEANGITSANIDEIKANPVSPAIAKFVGATPGYGSALGLPDDWAYNMIKEVGNAAEVYDRNLGSGSPYNLPRGINALYSDGGVFYPLIID